MNPNIGAGTIIVAYLLAGYVGFLFGQASEAAKAGRKRWNGKSR